MQRFDEGNFETLREYFRSPFDQVNKLHVIKYGEYYIIFNLLKSTGHVMHQQFNVQQLYALPTLYLYVLYLSENKQRLVPLTA